KEEDDQGMAMVKAAKQPITPRTPEEEAGWKERAKPGVDAWVASTPDGAKVLAAYRAEIAKIRAEKSSSSSRTRTGPSGRCLPYRPKTSPDRSAPPPP